MYIGQVLKKWRLMSEMTLRQAATQIGVDEGTLYRIELGGMPSGETLRDLISFLLRDAPKPRKKRSS